MKILAIETSCDETAIALVEANGLRRAQAKAGLIGKPQFKVLENIVSSQIAIHRPFGGVVPNLAKREHLVNLPKIWEQLKKKKVKFDLIAVTVGPGLEPALWAGIEFAKKLSEETGKPLIGANHLEGHMYSTLLPPRNPKSETLNSKQIQNPKSKIQKSLGFRISNLEFPAILLLVSGGHTILLKMDSLTKWKNLGETRDDAAGEAFDKVARLLGLQYPGGPEIEKLAKNGNPKAVNFPRPMLHENPAKAGARGARYEFSFSGLKTSVLYYLLDNANKKGGYANDANSSNDSHNLTQGSHCNVADVCASFQQAVIDVLVGKTMRAAEEFGAKSVLLSGGVAANKRLREIMKLETEKLGREFFVPDFQYNTDNAVMIAAAAYIAKLRGKKYPMRANSNLGL